MLRGVTAPGHATSLRLGLPGFEGVVAGLSDSDADNFRQTDARDSLALGGRKSDADEVGDHVAIEAMHPDQQCLRGAMRANGEEIEQLQRATRVRAETLSSGRHPFIVGRKPFMFT
jgi:hypothetical protein